MGTLHQPHVQAKISQVGDQTIMTSNKGWSFGLNGPPPSSCRRCGGMHWEMFPCGPQGTVSVLLHGKHGPADREVYTIHHHHHHPFSRTCS